jgi:hypothetical protein
MNIITFTIKEQVSAYEFVKFDVKKSKLEDYFNLKVIFNFSQEEYKRVINCLLNKFSNNNENFEKITISANNKINLFFGEGNVVCYDFYQDIEKKNFISINFSITSTNKSENYISHTKKYIHEHIHEHIKIKRLFKIVGI